MSSTTDLTFNGICFDVIDRNGQPWIRASQLAAALGYAREDQIARLYQRNADEFTENMTQVIEIVAEHHFGANLSNGRMRIFSLRGAHLLAMFARTAVAKSFRVWVLDVLETWNGRQQPALESTVTPSTANDRASLRALVHAWAQLSGVSHQALWPQVKAHFQLARIDDLPKEWIPDALAFVQGKIDALQAVRALPAPKPETTPAQRMAMDSIARLRKIALDYSVTSESLFGSCIKDDVVQSLHLATVLSMQALASHYTGMAARG